MKIGIQLVHAKIWKKIGKLPACWPVGINQQIRITAIKSNKKKSIISCSDDDALCMLPSSPAFTGICWYSPSFHRIVPPIFRLGIVSK